MAGPQRRFSSDALFDFDLDEDLDAFQPVKSARASFVEAGDIKPTSAVERRGTTTGKPRGSMAGLSDATLTEALLVQRHFDTLYKKSGQDDLFADFPRVEEWILSLRTKTLTTLETDFQGILHFNYTNVLHSAEISGSGGRRTDPLLTQILPDVEYNPQVCLARTVDTINTSSLVFARARTPLSLDELTKIRKEEGKGKGAGKSGGKAAGGASSSNTTRMMKKTTGGEQSGLGRIKARLLSAGGFFHHSSRRAGLRAGL